jgi:hypothetical protein
MTLTCAAVLPNRPGSHMPLHESFVKAGSLPNRPSGQSMQYPEPWELNKPVGHRTAVAVIEPAEHTYPAAHGPVHNDVVKPAVSPYRPASHW